MFNLYRNPPAGAAPEQQVFSFDSLADYNTGTAGWTPAESGRIVFRRDLNGLFEWDEGSLVPLDRRIAFVHAPSTDVAAADIANPTDAEISNWNQVIANADSHAYLFYTGTDTATDPKTHIWFVNDANEYLPMVATSAAAAPRERYFATDDTDFDDIDDDQFLQFQALTVQNPAYTNFPITVSDQGTGELIGTVFSFPNDKAREGILRLECSMRKKAETAAAAESFTANLESADGATIFAQSDGVVISSSTSLDSYNPTVLVVVEYRGIIPAGQAFRVRCSGIEADDEVNQRRVSLSFEGEAQGTTAAAGGPHVQAFNATSDWGAAAGGFFTITVAQATHGKARPSLVQLWQDQGGAFERVEADRVQRLADGSIEIRVPEVPNGRFAGEVSIGG